MAAQAVARRPGPGVPRWVWWVAGAAVAVALLVALGYGAYGRLDSLYPQELWRYFRPAAAPGPGSVLYRDVDGRLLLAPLADSSGARLLSAPSGEVVRDAVSLPGGPGGAGGGAVAYFASARRPGEAQTDRLKVVGLDGAVRQDVAVATAAGEPLLPTLYPSRSGRYVALTSRDRARAYYVDTTTGAVAPGTADAPPEPVQWHRNGDLRLAPVPGDAPYALSPDGRLRALVRPGTRRAPDCGEGECETVSELTVAPQPAPGAPPAPAGDQNGVALYGTYSSISAAGWGPIPAQPAARFYGRLIWSPDASQLLFTTLDGEESRVFTVGADGRTRPGLVLDGAEALDWLP